MMVAAEMMAEEALMVEANVVAVKRERTTIIYLIASIRPQLSCYFPK